jgi:tRNA pseudouridine55 synthase
LARQRKRKGDPISGWLNLFKPVDMTSTQAVGALKRLYNAQKVGHGGTLDPLADGILPIAFGEATKTVPWMMESEKEYVFTIRWGISTASQDAEGEVIAETDARPTREAVEALLGDYVGVIEQVPPKFSAIKVDGKRAYDLAREGEDFELKAREVTVYDAQVLSMPDADHTVIHVTSGKGFYVRAMARDLAFDLGCEGHISQLRRNRVGVFKAAQAVSLEGLQGIEDKGELLAALQPLQRVLTDMPELVIGREDVRELKQGRTIVLLPHLVEQWRTETNDDDDDRMAVVTCDGVAIALGDVRAGRFEPTRVFQV